MTWAKDLTIDHYYVLPRYPNVCILREKINNYQDEKKTLLKFEDCVNREEEFYIVVNQHEEFDSECCGCIISGGKKTRRKMKKRKPRKSRKARKSARG